uniref:BRCA1-associated 2/ETP1 RRM domain-containing protein n=1 Tax=Schistocephalus solidus TaxID=70667 RepID=A0A0X3PWK6_SCHSO
MLTSNVHSISILINEKVPNLSEKITFSAPGFIALCSETKFSSDSPVLLSPGKRVFANLKIITYNFIAANEMPGTSKKPNKISFVSGNPTVEKTEGIIHLFKTKNKKETTAGCQTSSMLCMLGIPSNITVKDLLNFCAPMRRGILELKIVKGSHVGRYMALLNFENQEYADQFYEALNGVAYNSLEPDICQLAYISHVEAIHSSLGGTFPLRGLVELPSCPVCLEKLVGFRFVNPSVIFHRTNRFKVFSQPFFAITISMTNVSLKLRKPHAPFVGTYSPPRWLLTANALTVNSARTSGSV